MSGNVSEWTESCWRADYKSVKDCRGKVSRGGSWYIYPFFMNSARREGHPPDSFFSDLGF